MLPFITLYLTISNLILNLTPSNLKESYTKLHPSNPKPKRNSNLILNLHPSNFNYL